MKKIYAINNILFLIFMLIAIPTIFMSEIGSNFNWPRKHKEIISNSEVSELLKDNKRKSLISIEEILLVDSSANLFIIPINQKTLKRSQEISISTDFCENIPAERVDALLRELPEKLVSVPKFLVSGTYNNIVLYNQRQNNEKALFNERVCVTLIQLLKINDKSYILCRYSDDDTNKDGEIDYTDIQYIAIYDLEGNKIKEIKIEGFSLYNVAFALENKLIIKAENQKYVKVTYGDPMQLILVDFLTGKHKLLVSTQLQDYIQNILDGKILQDGAQKDNR